MTCSFHEAEPCEERARRRIRTFFGTPLEVPDCCSPRGESPVELNGDGMAMVTGHDGGRNEPRRWRRRR